MSEDVKQIVRALIRGFKMIVKLLEDIVKD